MVTSIGNKPLTETTWSPHDKIKYSFFILISFNGLFIFVYVMTLVIPESGNVSEPFLVIFFSTIFILSIFYVIGILSASPYMVFGDGLSIPKNFHFLRTQKEIYIPYDETESIEFKINKYMDFWQKCNVVYIHKKDGESQIIPGTIFLKLKDKLIETIGEDRWNQLYKET